MIDFEKQLNPAQWEAVRSPGGPMLVIAGAGSGKTRTIVYRLAWLVGQGVAPDSILLLTFTRKAASQMLERASALLGSEGAALAGVQGGTFHSFAFSLLRRFPGALGRDRLTVMDQSEAQAAVAGVREELGLAKGDKSFPKRAMVLALISKARNKEMPLEEILSAEAFHLLPHVPALAQIAAGYEKYKAESGLLDYDDLLSGLEKLLATHEPARDWVRRRISHVMVDEYQDTNPVQARLVRLLAGEKGNVMAVGDDAQSIYAFRGADVQNILRFPRDFPGASLVRLEQNYRSTQPILVMPLRSMTTMSRAFLPWAAWMKRSSDGSTGNCWVIDKVLFWKYIRILLPEPETGWCVHCAPGIEWPRMRYPERSHRSDERAEILDAQKPMLPGHTGSRVQSCRDNRPRHGTCPHKACLHMPRALP